MTVSLNTFQQAVNTSNIDGYIKLSKDKSSVESYNAGFFARHFHTHASRDENREVRRAFYESITSQYKCSNAFCASLRKELGIDSGNHDALSIQDAQDILQRVKIAAHTLDNKDVIESGRPFEYSCGSAFQKEILDLFQDTINESTKPDQNPTIAQSFDQPLKDYVRPATGLKLGNVVVARLRETPLLDQRPAVEQAMLQKVENFFQADTVNGNKAARIISALAHQGICADIMKTLPAAKDPIDCILLEVPSSIMDFSVDRNPDGSYSISSDIVLSCKSIMDETMQPLFLDNSHSRLNFKLDLTLSFDNAGTPEIKFSKQPTLSGQFVQLPNIDMKELLYVQDPNDKTVYVNQALFSGKINDPNIRSALETGDINFLSTHLITESDKKLLDCLNVDYVLVTDMTTGWMADGNVPHLDKETILHLRSNDSGERNNAISKLKTMLQPLANHGWIEASRITGLRPEILNLVTVADLSLIPPDDTSPSDAQLVAAYMRTSDDPNHHQILIDLGAGDPSTVAAAKNNVMAILTMLRNPSAPPPAAAPQPNVHQTTTITTDGSEPEQPSTPAAPPPIAPQPNVHQTTTITTDGSEPEQPSTPAPPPPVTPQPDAPPTAVDSQPPTPNPT